MEAIYFSGYRLPLFLIILRGAVTVHMSDELGDSVKEGVIGPAEDLPNKTVSVWKLLLTYPQTHIASKESLVVFLKGTVDPDGQTQVNKNYGGCIVGKENHHETEGEHYHVLLILRKSMKIKIRTLRTILCCDGETPNIQFVTNSKASIARVAKYVTKDGDYLEDNLKLKTLIQDTKTRRPLIEMLETPIFDLVKAGDINSGAAYRALLWAQQHWAGIHRQEDCNHMRGIWLYGNAGAGKTTSARQFGKASLFLKAQNKWFDGYMGEKVIVLDDLDTSTLNHYLKIWSDRWACRGEVKGGMVWLRHEYFIVTSNYSIQGLMDKDNICDPALYDAMKRRFLEIPVQEVFDLWEIINLEEHSQWHYHGLPDWGAGEQATPGAAAEEGEEASESLERAEEGWWERSSEGAPVDEAKRTPSPSAEPATSSWAQTPARAEALLGSAFPGGLDPAVGPQYIDRWPESEPPMEPSLHSEPEVAEPAPKRAPLQVPVWSAQAAFSGPEPWLVDVSQEAGELPQLASEPGEEGADSDGLSGLDSSTDWSELRRAGEGDPSEEMSGGCEVGESYSGEAESEPSGEDL